MTRLTNGENREGPARAGASRGVAHVVLALLASVTMMGCVEMHAVVPFDDDIPLVDTCIPDCDGELCGDDGCGGTCGCQAPESCSEESICCDPASIDCQTPDEACSEDSWESDNSQADAHDVHGSANMISSETHIPAPGNTGLSICPKGDLDWMRIQLEGVQSMRVKVTPAKDLPMDLVFVPEDPGSEAVLTVVQTPGGGAEGSIESIGPGTYFVGVKGFAAHGISQTIPSYTFIGYFVCQPTCDGDGDCDDGCGGTCETDC